MFVLLCTLSLITSTALDANPGDLKKLIKTHENVHVMFYAPWCGHCKSFKPTFHSVAEESHPKTVLALLDCTEHQSTCQDYNVEGYPTIIHIKNGLVNDNYNGPRTYDDYLRFVREAARAPLTEIFVMSEYESLMDGSEVIAFGYFCKGDDGLEQFKEVSGSNLRNIFDFYYTKNITICQKAQFDDHVVLRGLPSSPAVSVPTENLHSWMTTTYLGPCGHRNTRTEKLFKGTVLMAYFPVDNVHNKKYTQYYIKRMEKVMKDYSGQFMCGYSNLEDVKGTLGLQEEKVAVFMFDEDGKKFKMAGVFSVETVVGFVEDFFGGKLKPHVKSLPIPEEKVEGLTELVGLNFAEVVNQPKNVFVLFHAPWCGHCKNVMPIFEDLARKLASDDSVVIARIDATTNEFPDVFQVRGFPTFYLVTREGKESPIRFEGERNQKSFVDFLKKHCGELAGNFGEL